MKVKPTVKKLIYPIRWRWQIGKRILIEDLQKYRKWDSDPSRVLPYVVFMTGMPRTGSSLMKNFLGNYKGFKISPFNPDGFYKSWEKSLLENDLIYIDKSTHYIRHLDKILATCNNKVAFCCIVRDPRDQLVSLFEFERHPEIKRNQKFWKQWLNQYINFINFAKSNPNNKFFLLRYEDMVAYPKKAKFDFLNWLNIHVVEEELELTYNVMSNDIQDDKVADKTAVLKDSIGRYKLVEDPFKKTIIYGYKKDKAVINLMKSLSYLPDLSNLAKNYFDNVTLFLPTYKN